LMAITPGIDGPQIHETLMDQHLAVPEALPNSLDCPGAEPLAFCYNRRTKRGLLLDSVN
jgi:hypothetical protein